MPPPSPLALLAEKVLLITFTVPPLFKMPPPAAPVERPFAMVSLRSVSVLPLFTIITRTELFPLTVMLCAPPSIVTSSVIAARVEPSVMVPLMLKVIAFAPVPAAHSGKVCALSLALMIASRKLHKPSPGVISSTSVLTVITTGGVALATKAKNPRVSPAREITNVASTRGLQKADNVNDFVFISRFESRLFSRFA